MNFKELNKVGSNQGLRPVPIRIELDGALLPPSHDQWQLQTILTNLVVNIPTRHVVDFSLTTSAEYRKPKTSDGHPTLFPAVSVWNHHQR
jgi:hypothetical protein